MRSLRLWWLVALVAALGWLGSSSLALAQEASPAAAASAWSSFAAALSTDGGRVAAAGAIYVLLALMKLIPAVRDAATPGGKIFAVVALALGTGAAAWSAPGCSVWIAIATAVAAGAGAVFAHEAIEKVARMLLPLLAAIPRVGPAIAAAVRAVFVPSAPPVDVVAAERALKSTAKTGAVLLVLLSLTGCASAQAHTAGALAIAGAGLERPMHAIETAAGNAALVRVHAAGGTSADGDRALEGVEARWAPAWAALDLFLAADAAWLDAILAQEDGDWSRLVDAACGLVRAATPLAPEAIEKFAAIAAPFCPSEVP